MCGITGILAHNMIGQMHMIQLSRATELLESRGPDNAGYYTEGFVGLGHRRLSIIDISYESNQPFTDESGRYTIVYNGELYNYKNLKQELTNTGYSFRSEGDTEVLLQAFIAYGKDFVNKLDGFFAFCIYDKEENTFFLARDRYGIKPLLYFHDDDKFIFGSRLDSILAYNIPVELNKKALRSYLRFNYTPGTGTMVKGVHKVSPGESITVLNDSTVIQEKYYEVKPHSSENLSKERTKDKLRELLSESVKNRLVSDVPVGTFLSGGIDSSIITKLASEHQSGIQSFSIGFRGNKFFDESQQAAEFAKKHSIQHHIFHISEDDMLSNIDTIIDSFDEPFADSSAVAVNTLSKNVSSKIKVALSGDGADEIFAGYNKHKAEYMALNPGLKENLVGGLGWLWNILPKNRNSGFGNRVRQFQRFNDARKLSPRERYFKWASMGSADYLDHILTDSYKEELSLDFIANHFSKNGKLKDTLLADLKLVLPSDMLYKVDVSSMAHSLEVRVPFLDQKVVDFGISISDQYKIHKGQTKHILKDTFSDYFTSDMLNRKKKGFEVPLRAWLLGTFSADIDNFLLDKEFINTQGIFNSSSLDTLVDELKSSNSGDAHARVWAILVFQKWWKKYFD